ncbi:MAG: magnesium chelatase domain-containing protein [Melioribacteraceae bacterium]|nr:magnesium chelatase domain-containing protein [Melioribacteraceae bacterium]
MAGGLRIEEPAIDLAVCAAIASSLKEENAKESLVAVGEVGLGGEVRGVSNIEKRIAEAEKLGFEQIVIPKANMKSVKKKSKIKVVPVEDVSSAIEMILV